MRFGEKRFVVFAASVFAAAIGVLSCGGENQTPVPARQPAPQAALVERKDLTPAEAAREILAGQSDVIEWKRIPAGRYVLTQYRHFLFVGLEQGKSIAASYVHDLSMPGKLRESDAVYVREDQKPAEEGYYTELPVALPTRIVADPAAGEPQLGDFVFYEPHFSHRAFARTAWHWNSHDNPMRGFNFFSVCREELGLTMGDEGKTKTYYAGFVRGFSEEHGTVYGWVQSRARLGAVVELTFFFRKAGGETALVTAQYVDPAQQKPFRGTEVAGSPSN